MVFSMASLNVAEWTPDDVANWLSGLGDKVAPYVEPLRERGLNGQRLLILRCDDLEYLGVTIIGHQEIILEAVEHLRNFYYETKRECIQQLALRVAVVGGGLARALALQQDARLSTAALADVATLVRAVKPLAWWLERCGCAALARRRGALLLAALEAATCAQRERFAETPARAVGGAAGGAAAAAAALVRGHHPALLTPAALDAVRLAQGARPLGFRVSAHARLVDIRFGSPAHAAPRLREGDEIVQVGAQCVVGWEPGAVAAACGAEGAARGDLLLRLRRRPPAPPPPPGARPAAAAPAAPAPRPASPATSDDSEPAAPAPGANRIFPLKPLNAIRRRHTIGSGRPQSERPSLGLEQLWAELKEHRWAMGGSGSQVDHDDATLYRRDKAVSYSTGLELSPRPKTYASPQAAPAPVPAPPAPPAHPRGTLDKCYSAPDAAPPCPLSQQTIPESPSSPADSPTIQVHSAEKADAILDFKKSSTQIAEAILQRSRRDTITSANEEEVLETVNDAIVDRYDGELDASVTSVTSVTSDASHSSERARRRAAPLPALIANSVLKPVPRSPDLADSTRTLRLDASQISLPYKHITKQDIQMIGSVSGALPALNPAPASPPRPAPPPASLSPSVGVVRGIFPTSKTKSLKKKNSILAKRRQVSPARLEALGGCGGGAWQRVRAGAAARWARRHLLLLHSLLYAFRSRASSKADCMLAVAGFTVCAADEVRSREFAFKVYHTGRVLYFAADSEPARAAWIHSIHRATMLPPLHAAMDLSMQYSETDYSETESDAETSDPQIDNTKEFKEKDKSKFGSLKKLTHRMQRSESQENVTHASTSLDRKYLRIFSRHKSKDDIKNSNKHSKLEIRGALQGAPHASHPDLLHAATSSTSTSSTSTSSTSSTSTSSTSTASNTSSSSAATSPAARKPELAGLLTLEEFMLRKQEEERAQGGGQRGVTSRTHTHTHTSDASVRQEKSAADLFPSNRGAAADVWRDSLRRNDKVHSSSPPLSVRLASPIHSPENGIESGGVSRLRLMFSGRPAQAEPRGPGAQYPHLQCPPTFQPETYTLAPPASAPHNNHTLF